VAGVSLVAVASGRSSNQDPAVVPQTTKISVSVVLGPVTNSNGLVIMAYDDCHFSA
jgi:hypothetical protein